MNASTRRLKHTKRPKNNTENLMESINYISCVHITTQRRYPLVHIMETDHVLEQKKPESFAQCIQEDRGCRSTLKTERDQASISYSCHRRYFCRYCHYLLVLFQVLGESAQQVGGGNMQI